jgi:hypothetical protein
MDSEQAERWEIDQDEFGNPLVRHRHPTMTVAAYVSKDVDGRRLARCPDCREEVEVPAQPEAGR